MGLDMYLNARRYLWSVDKADQKIAEEVALLLPEIKGITPQFSANSPVKEVVIEAGYWRKANAIHRWFVENVQGGTDDCNPYPVSREQLEELRELCRTVLANRDKAADLLPTTSGFFFGGTEYTDYYFEDLEITIRQVDEVLKLPIGWEIEYRSSW